MKKVLFIENGFFSDMKGTTIDKVYNRLIKQGVEVKIIDRASHNIEQVIEGVMWCDSIYFASTFIYEDEVKGIGDLLIKVPLSKSIYGDSMSGYSFQYHLENIWNLEELAKMSHHKVFEIKGIDYSSEPSEVIYESVNMLLYKEQWDNQEIERIKKNQGFKKVGRSVLIGKVEAVGKQWSNLKEGDIVDELDCTEIDPNPKKGIWVMGFDEPVKLLNSDGYEEWQYAELKSDCLAREFFSRGNALDKTELIKVVSDWICYGSLANLSDSEIWEWCDNLCKTVGVERRGNRYYFDKRLKEYAKKHIYFLEKKRD